MNWLLHKIHRGIYWIPYEVRGWLFIVIMFLVMSLDYNSL